MDVRNVAIIAHVDHGKTTLVDVLLRQSGTVAAHVQMPERVMDRLDLEQERGITILSKNTAIEYRGVTINIVDTPGHADFGGEVERVLNMVDSVLLLVDAYEGPMPQTKFVLRKALSHGLPPIVVINKCDRPDARPAEVLDLVFDLFIDLDATDEQLDFQVLYASAREGWAITDLEHEARDLGPLLSTLLEHVPPPDVDEEGPFRLQPATIDYDEFVGRIAVGRISRGVIRKGAPLVCVDADGNSRPGKVVKLVGYSGLEQIALEEARAGDIIGIAGFSDVLPGETLCDPAFPDPLPPIAVDEPTVAVEILVSNGPFAGLSGKKVTSRALRTRLLREVQSNVSLRVEETDSADVFAVAGRGELHLTVLMETLRREDFEFCVSMPRVVLKEGPGGKQEPYEDVVVECDEPFSGVVIQELNSRGGELLDLKAFGTAARMQYRIPSRGLIGYRTLFLSQTRGTGTLYHTFAEYGPWRGPLKRRASGVLVSMGTGRVTAYALETLQERGVLLVEPGDQVYAGQVVGEHARGRDLPVNPTRVKKLDNMRSSTKEITVKLDTARKLTLEQALEFVNDDELVDITPDAIRIRKRILDESERRRADKRDASS